MSFVSKNVDNTIYYLPVIFLLTEVSSPKSIFTYVKSLRDVNILKPNKLAIPVETI